MEMYENEKNLYKNIYETTYVFAHNDHFGRDKTQKELIDVFKKNKEQFIDRFKIKVLSKNADNNVNLFVLKVYTKNKPLKMYYGEFEDCWFLSCLQDIYYYDFTECNYNEVEGDLWITDR